MTHYQPQPDCSVTWSDPKPNDACPSREIGTRAVCWIVFAILVVHWLGMHWFIQWIGGEQIVARGQAVSAFNSTHSNKQVDDGWRRTSKGWEYLAAQPIAPKAKSFVPTVHIAPSQIWPAAAAACMMLLIAGLPDKSAKTKNAPSSMANNS